MIAIKRPRVSVVMTIYNHQDFLSESIKSLINQSFKNWELIACENGSRDHSKDILKKFKDKRIKKFFLKKNIGRTNCLNYALKKTKGEYIAILDSDDIALKHRLKKQLKYLDENLKTVLVGTWYSRINKYGKVINKINQKIDNNFSLRNFLFINSIGHSTIMFRKNIIKKIGMYPKKIKFMQDYAFFLKIYKKFKIDIMPINLTNCRYHHANSETSRVLSSTLIEKEWLNLLLWIKKNFNLSLLENILFFFNYFKLNFKILKKNKFI